MKTNIEINKKTMILIASAIGAVMIAILFTGPLYSKAKGVAIEAKALDVELADIRNALMKASKIDQKGYLQTRNEVSMAINEITNLGNQLKIAFLSTNPQQVQKSEDSVYPILPIHLEIKSTFEDLSIFLGALGNIEKGVATVEEFSIERQPEILPEIITGLIVEIYLKEGEGG